jgi:hypothetical protein
MLKTVALIEGGQMGRQVDGNKSEDSVKGSTRAEDETRQSFLGLSLEDSGAASGALMAAVLLSVALRV